MAGVAMAFVDGKRKGMTTRLGAGNEFACGVDARAGAALQLAV